MDTLFKFWTTSKNLMEEKSVKQILTICGNGHLLDGNSTSSEFRNFLSRIPSEQLKRYAEECLETPFDHSGLALQDLINQVGIRLSLRVENGFYRGSKKDKKIGFDGIWTTSQGHSFVVEVKTTDAYRISLDTVAEYRRKLIQEQRIDPLKSSCLIVVGREDTGELESQIRGSRQAWDMRVVSVGALTKLMLLKESLNDVKTIQQIHEILKPHEYTRLDRIIDIMFDTSEDVKVDDIEHSEPEPKDTEENKIRASYNDLCIERISKYLKNPLIKVTRTQYGSDEAKYKVCCIVSKKYHRTGMIRYWYAYHPNYSEFLLDSDNGENSYVSFGCETEQKIILMPIKVFLPYLDQMRTTEKNGRMYWHVEIFEKDDRFYLNRIDFETDITNYLLDSGKP